MSMASSQSVNQTKKRSSGSRVDPGWEHGTDVDATGKKVKCNYCNKIYSGGIFRLKHHLAGTCINVGACSLVPQNAKESFKTQLQVSAQEAEKKKQQILDIGGNMEEDESYEILRNRKGKSTIDRMLSKSAPKVQSTLNQIYKKEERDDVCQQISRFLYTSAISFNVVNNPEFPIMIDKISKYGMGFKPPSFHEVRVKFLNMEVSNVMTMIKEHKVEWKKTGCTIMSDGWTDNKRRTLCNFLVNSPMGSVFLKSIDASNISKTSDKIFEMLDDVVEMVGEENVVQIVTDNAANYKAAGEKLMEKRKRLFWTPCAAHCIDLMLEDFDKKLKVHTTTIENAKRITTFIYSRTLLHTWLKEFTKGRELIRPGATRFATSYLTLRCLNGQWGSLLAMFASNKWKSSRFASLAEGKKVESIVMDTSGFWHDITTCLKASLPLVKVLRMVDSDQPAMGFMYSAMEEAKKQIRANFKDVERHYKPILDIIDHRWESQLHRPLHAAAHFLNPQVQYDPNFTTDASIRIGLYDCMTRMVPDPNEKVKIDLQIDEFKKAKGMFGLPIAIMTRSLKSPADWWDSFGGECPELKNFAIRILSLTCSSSGCERNWSAFEMVHTKKRNRLRQEKLNDLVFVMYNLKLKHRRQSKKGSIKESMDLDENHEIPSDDEWITEAENPELLDALSRVLIDEDQSHETVYSSRCDNEEVGDMERNFDDGIADDGDDQIGAGSHFGSDGLYEENYGYDD